MLPQCYPKRFLGGQMPKMKFTAKALDAIRPQGKREEYWDEQLGGSFGLRVNKSGQKSWVVMYRVKGRLRRFTIGNYRDYGLADARAKARDILAEASRGFDPQEKKIQARKAETFRELAEEYIEKYAKVNKRSWKEDLRNLETDILPYWKMKKASEIKRRDVLLLLDEIINRGAPIQANRVLALVRKIFNFGIQRDIIEINPCQAVSRPTDERSRQGQKVLSFEEIRKVWSAIDAQKEPTASIFKMRLLTAQRGIEVRSMKWDDIDFETGFWTIPPHIVKNKLQHRVPLSRQALYILDNLQAMGNQSPYVFPSPKNSNKNINNVNKAVERIRELSGVDFVDRDLRRTVASHLTGHLNIPRLVVSKILNHVESGITRVYDRHSYDKEKTQALSAWGSLLMDVVSKKESEQSNVFRLHI